jgi:hypothetical protein
MVSSTLDTLRLWRPLEPFEIRRKRGRFPLVEPRTAGVSPATPFAGGMQAMRENSPTVKHRKIGRFLR